MIPPRDQDEAACDPDKKAELLCTSTGDLPDAEPAEDPEAGAGVFEQGIDGDGGQGSTSFLVPGVS
jgi:hypothetical protein